jgi:tellurite resistance protein
MFNLGEVFAAITWDERRDQALAVAELALWAATSDGVIEPAEVSAIVTKIRALERYADFTEDEARAILAEFDDYEDDLEVEGRIHEITEQITDPKLRRAAYQLAVVCAANDGVLTDDERDFLEFLRESFALSTEEAARLAGDALA